MKIVDLRSDTVTLPTQQMLEATLSAKLGDDQYGEDETVNKLQELAAEKMGKESALLVTSGTQANLVSIMSQTQHGDAAILERESHIMYYEASGLAAVAGVLAIPLKGNHGTLNSSEVEDRLGFQHRIHQPKITLICLENTHNRAGGVCIKPDQIKTIVEVARDHGSQVYIDGARIFNAAIALGIDPRALTKDVDAVSFCLSKGLSAPVGSLVTGDNEFIKKARVNRQRLGGAMRQSGVIAAPGIVALETMIERLKDDHNNAKILAKGLVDLGFPVDLDTVQTNIVLIDVSWFKMDSLSFSSALLKFGIKVSSYGRTLVRMVTHRGIKQEHIKYTLESIGHLVKLAMN